MERFRSYLIERITHYASLASDLSEAGHARASEWASGQFSYYFELWNTVFGG